MLSRATRPPGARGRPLARVSAALLLAACTGVERGPSPGARAPAPVVDASSTAAPAGDLLDPAVSAPPDAPSEPPPIELAAPTGRAPASLSGQLVASYNRHFDGGADGEELDAAITISFAADGDVTIAERGAHSESLLLSGRGHTEKRRRWETAWRGRWTDADGGLRLIVAPGERACERASLDTADRETRAPCEPAPQRLELACARTRVRARPRDASGEERALWSCSAVGDGALDTPGPWAVDERCVRVSRGPGGRSYARCQERDAEP